MANLEEPEPQVDYVSSAKVSTRAELEPGGVSPFIDPVEVVEDLVQARTVDLPVDRLTLVHGERLEPDSGAGREVGPVSVGLSKVPGSARPGADLRVRLLSSKRAHQLGGQRVAFQLGWSEASVSGGVAQIAVDYSAFEDEFGADWGGRVRLMALPACVTANPVPEDCEPSATAVEGAENDLAARQVVAKVPLRSDSSGSVFALAAEAQSETGNYQRTDLSAASEWTAGLQSGDFSWSYPVSVLAPPAGVAPSVNLSYSSQALDGLSRDRNTQGGQLGPGWSMSDAFIERRFKPCAYDGGSVADMCYIDPNGFVSFGPVAGRLIAVSSDDLGGGWTSTVWRLEKDPGWRFELRTRQVSEVRGSLGVDNDGEHWIATSPDGTKYWFGYGRESGDLDPGTALGSVQTVPIVGNQSGEPCSTLENNWCHQAYRWSLDRVEDPNGRVATMHYSQQTNHYGTVGQPNASQPYVSSAVLERIEYGQVEQNAGIADSHTNQVVFEYDFRCDNPVDSECTEPPSEAQGEHFPDIPVDQLCTPTESCLNYTPTFFYRHKLVRIAKNSRQATGGGLTLVDEDVLRYEWRDADGSGTDPARLWLGSVQRRGLAGPDVVATPPVRFNSETLLANRADPDPPAGVTEMRLYRIDSIIDELGRDAADR